MAEIALYFGHDGRVVAPVSLSFARLDLHEGDFVLCTIPKGLPPEALQAIAEQLRDMLDERGYREVRVILLTEGAELTKLTVEELATLRLAPI